MGVILFTLLSTVRRAKWIRGAAFLFANVADCLVKALYAGASFGPSSFFLLL